MNPTVEPHAEITFTISTYDGKEMVNRTEMPGHYTLDGNNIGVAVAEAKSMLYEGAEDRAEIEMEVDFKTKSFRFKMATVRK